MDIETDKLRVKLLRKSGIITAKEAKQLFRLKWTTGGTPRIRAPKGSSMLRKRLFRANRQEEKAAVESLLELLSKSH